VGGQREEGGGELNRGLQKGKNNTPILIKSLGTKRNCRGTVRLGSKGLTRLQGPAEVHGVGSVSGLVLSFYVSSWATSFHVGSVVREKAAPKNKKGKGVRAMGLGGYCERGDGGGGGTATDEDQEKGKRVRSVDLLMLDQYAELAGVQPYGNGGGSSLVMFPLWSTPGTGGGWDQRVYDVLSP